MTPDCHRCGLPQMISESFSTLLLILNEAPSWEGLSSPPNQYLWSITVGRLTAYLAPLAVMTQTS